MKKKDKIMIALVAITIIFSIFFTLRTSSNLAQEKDEKIERTSRITSNKVSCQIISEKKTSDISDIVKSRLEAAGLKTDSFNGVSTEKQTSTQNQTK